MKAIIVNKLSKKYPINIVKRTSLNRSLKDRLAGHSYSELLIKLFRRLKRVAVPKKPSGDWALKDISFSLNQGEILGIIGPNGSGKSTLLRVLAGITSPTKGRAVLTGKIVSILGLGIGFHSDLSGKENIFLSGAVLGIKKKDIDKDFNNIVKFSGIKKFINAPVKYYSSGMYLRLAFAIATSQCLKPDILLIDEVLSVGDASFRDQCYKRIFELSRTNQTTVILVSHELKMIEALSTQCLLLENGKIKLVGSPIKVLKSYSSTFNKPV